MPDDGRNGRDFPPVITDAERARVTHSPRQPAVLHAVREDEVTVAAKRDGRDDRIPGGEVGTPVTAVDAAPV
jgi:hypothetical protein